MSEQFDQHRDFSPEDRIDAQSIVHDALTEGSADANHLRTLKTSFRNVLYAGPSYGSDGGAIEALANKPNRAMLASRGLMDSFEHFMEEFDGVIQAEQRAYIEEVNVAIRLLGDGAVSVSSDGEQRTVEGVALHEGTIVPVIDGVPYVGAIDDVFILNT